MLSWEKPLVKPMAPESVFYYNTSLFDYIASRLLFCNLYFPIYTTKISKIFTLLSLLDLTFASDREGIDNPFIVLVARFLIVCAGTRWLVRRLHRDWYLGSQNWGKYLCYFAAEPFPLQGKIQRRLKRLQEGLLTPLLGTSTSSHAIPSTHYKLFSLALHYSPFASRFPLPHF